MYLCHLIVQFLFLVQGLTLYSGFSRKAYVADLTEMQCNFKEFSQHKKSRSQEFYIGDSLMLFHAIKSCLGVGTPYLLSGIRLRMAYQIGDGVPDRGMGHQIWRDGIPDKRIGAR